MRRILSSEPALNSYEDKILLQLWSFTEYLTYNVPSRKGFVNITPVVRKIVQKSGIKEELDFGPWEQIFYGEFDGTRPMQVDVKVIGE